MGIQLFKTNEPQQNNINAKFEIAARLETTSNIHSEQAEADFQLQIDPEDLPHDPAFILGKCCL